MIVRQPIRYLCRSVNYARKGNINNKKQKTRMTSVGYPRNDFTNFCSWYDNYKTAWLSEIQLQETETRNDQSCLHCP